MLSLSHFLPNLKFVLINDGTLFPWHIWLIKQTGLALSFVTRYENNGVRNKIKKLTLLTAFFDYGWSGKKFTIPLVYFNKPEKVLVLDCDTLFFRFPTEIHRWLETKNNNHLYLQDYEHFSVISPIEAKEMLHHHPHIIKVNSGLLCLNLPVFQIKQLLESIDKDIEYIIHFVKSRLTHDYNTDNDFVYVFPLIEQTLHWLILERSSSKSLSNRYLVYPIHKFKGRPIGNPTFIHYTGEVRVNYPMYKYLFCSLIEKISDVLLRHVQSTNPWFIYSRQYCPRCKHRHH